MTLLATPQSVRIEKEQGDVVMVIEGAGSLRMPIPAAHELARALMQAVAEIEIEAHPRGLNGKG